ncbi:LppA family lipoprotein [Mycobacterium sp.]|uniref:LppA family lipoprotein n=1 Tax=Mycobacterium sp. TaxID=1785 RepID=UPI00345B8D79
MISPWVDLPSCGKPFRRVIVDVCEANVAAPASARPSSPWRPAWSHRVYPRPHVMLDHDVRFYGPTGISIGVGYRGNLVVSGSTGCRLPRERK